MPEHANVKKEMSLSVGNKGGSVLSPLLLEQDQCVLWRLVSTGALF